MKHFINILVILILTGFAVGIAWLQYHANENNPFWWWLLYLPLLIMMIAWGEKVSKDYKDS